MESRKAMLKVAELSGVSFTGHDLRTFATSNLRMVEFVARKLGELNEEVVYLGGCSDHQLDLVIPKSRFVTNRS
jgi:hypothetical protein